MALFVDLRRRLLCLELSSAAHLIEYLPLYLCFLLQKAKINKQVPFLINSLYEPMLYHDPNRAKNRQFKIALSCSPEQGLIKVSVFAHGKANTTGISDGVPHAV